MTNPNIQVAETQQVPVTQQPPFTPQFPDLHILPGYLALAMVVTKPMIQALREAWQKVLQQGRVSLEVQTKFTIDSDKKK